MAALDCLGGGAAAGDSLVFGFSGHGAPGSAEAGGNALLPCDFRTVRLALRWEAAGFRSGPHLWLFVALQGELAVFCPGLQHWLCLALLGELAVPRPGLHPWPAQPQVHMQSERQKLLGVCSLGRTNGPEADKH